MVYLWYLKKKIRSKSVQLQEKTTHLQENWGKQNVL